MQARRRLSSKRQAAQESGRAPARDQRGSVAQPHEKLGVPVRLQRPDMVEVDHVGAMHAKEAPGGEPRLELGS